MGNMRQQPLELDWAELGTDSLSPCVQLFIKSLLESGDVRTRYAPHFPTQPKSSSKSPEQSELPLI